MAFKNYYSILGVKNEANLEEIKSAFRQLAKKYHPDTNNESKSAEDFFKEVQEAYETLSDTEKRRRYDQKFAYSNQYKQANTKAHGHYAGNAYQYAQQQTRNTHQHKETSDERESVKTAQKEKRTDSDSYFFIISIIIAILLLIFIISYSNKATVLP